VGERDCCKVLGNEELWENFLKWVRARCGAKIFFEGGNEEKVKGIKGRVDVA
jgi:hypothetical protein